jgi:ubiquinone biosynthesis protein
MLAYRVLENMESAQQEARAMREEQTRLQRELRERRTLIGAFSGAVLMLCGTLLLLLGPGALVSTLAAQILAGSALLLGVWLLFYQWRAAG